jgi:DNA-binding MarR family transcriptional regulator
MHKTADLERALVEVLEQVARLMRRLATAGELSMTPAAVLARLVREGPQRLTDLAVGERVTQPGMTQLVSRLEREGLVRRAPARGDRRGVLVEVTEAGRTLIARRRDERAAALRTMVGALSPQDRAAIGAALPALSRLVAAHPAFSTDWEHHQ